MPAKENGSKFNIITSEYVVGALMLRLYKQCSGFKRLTNKPWGFEKNKGEE